MRPSAPRVLAPRQSGQPHAATRSACARTITQPWASICHMRERAGAPPTHPSLQLLPVPPPRSLAHELAARQPRIVRRTARVRRRAVEGRGSTRRIYCRGLLLAGSKLTSYLVVAAPARCPLASSVPACRLLPFSLSPGVGPALSVPGTGIARAKSASCPRKGNKPPGPCSSAADPTLAAGGAAATQHSVDAEGSGRRWACAPKWAGWAVP